MKLAENRTARAVITITPDGESNLTPLADELARCLGAATGAEFEILDEPPQNGNRIDLTIDPALDSPTAETDRVPQRDIIAWRCDGEKRLELRGNTEVALWISMYAFLQDVVGFRWFFPGEEGEDVPERPELEIEEMDRVIVPSYVLRDFHCWSEQFQRRKLAGNRTMGVVHSYKDLIPAEILNEHPEYYSYGDGGRQVDSAVRQLCLSNKDVADYGLQYCLDTITSKPEQDIIGLSPNDCDAFCNCPDCVELYRGEALMDRDNYEVPDNVSRGVFTFSNCVAEKLAKTHPDRLISTIAYGRTKMPAPGMSVRDNVLVWYCPQPLENWHGESGRQLMRREVDGWTGIATHVGIFDYIVNQSWPGLPRPITKLLSTNLNYYHQRGVRYYYTQSGDDFGIHLPNYYLATALCWNIDQDPDDILDDMYTRCFGPAAKSVQRYFDTLEGAMMRVTAEDVGPGNVGITGHRRSHEGVLTIYRPEVMEEAEKALEEAEQKVSEEKHRKRLRLITDGFSLLKCAVTAARKTYDFETKYRIPTLTPWAWNVGNYDYHSAVEKLEMFGRPCIEQFLDILEAWRDYRDLRERLTDSLVVNKKYGHGASFFALPTLENIWKLYTGELKEVPRLVTAKSIGRVM